MSAIRVLLQNARLAVFAPGFESAIDIKGWLANQNYFFDDDLTDSEFSVRASNPAEIRQALANELNKFTCAAIESAAGVGPDRSMPRSLAWGAIRSYYSAFFAAHGLMRLFGTACVQLEPEHADKVFSSAQTFGKTGTVAALNAGFYVARIDPGFDRITFRRLQDSHRDTWAMLLTVIDAIDGAIKATTALSIHKIEASSLLSDLKAGLTRASSIRGNWLSLIRNAINYRHSYGVWFPYAQRAAQVSLLEVASRSWRAEPRARVSPSSNADLDTFFDIAMSLVALLRELVCAASDLHQPLNPTMKSGCLKLLNELQAKGRRPRRAQ